MKVFKNLFVIPPEAKASPFVVKHFKRNFAANFMDIATYFFGDSFLAAYTIMPVFVSTLTDSPIIIGLIPAIYEAGWFLPQMFFASHIRKRSRLVPLVTKLGFLERSSYLLLAAGAYFLTRWSTTTALAVILALIIWRSLSAGFYALPWQEVIAKVIPVSHRGRFFGWATMAGKLLGIVGALIAGYILEKLPYPDNYALIFLLGFIVVIVALGFFLITKEPENNLDSQAREESIRWKEEIPRIFSTNPSFRNFMFSRMLSFLGYMAMGFMAVYGIERYSLPESYSAIFTAILTATSLVGYALLGAVGDRKGNKLVYLLSDFTLILSILTVLVWQSLLGIYVMFGLMGISNAGAMIGDMNMPMEFGRVDERPIYIGLSKTLTGPFFLLAPIIGGAIVQSVSYRAMFITSLMFAVLAILTLAVYVSEPRRRKSDQSLTEIYPDRR